MIDSISVDLMVKDGTIEIFPFLVEIDRYKAAVGGQHNIDRLLISYLYPEITFAFPGGVDISGNLDKMKFRITKANTRIFLSLREKLKSIVHN